LPEQTKPMKDFDSSKDYYDILGIDEDATLDEIEKMFRRTAMRVHPDSGGSEEEMKALNEAHNILKDPATREAYDSSRDVPYHRNKERASAPFGYQDRPNVNAPAGYGSEDFLGRLISSLAFLGGGLIFFLVIEANWVFFLWPLRLLSLGILAVSIYWTYLTFKLKQQRLKSSLYRKLAEAGFWLVVCAAGCGLFMIMIFLH
jgi:hypothetical protein